jgi:hypothetical protein
MGTPSFNKHRLAVLFSFLTTVVVASPLQRATRSRNWFHMEHETGQCTSTNAGP